MPIESVFLESNFLSGVAQKAADRAIDDPDQALVAVVFSCAWLESAVNEILHDLENIPRNHLPTGYPSTAALARETGLFEDRAPFERKIRILGLARIGRAVDFGAEPFQSLDVLLRIRNWLVHLKPEVVSVRDEPNQQRPLAAEEDHKLARELFVRQVLDRKNGAPGASLVTAIRFPRVAEWSYTVAHAIVSEIATWFPDWKVSILIPHGKPKAGWSPTKRFQPAAKARARMSRGELKPRR